MRKRIIVTAVCLAIASGRSVAGPETDTRQPTNIPAQQLACAVQVLATERDYQVIYRSELVGEQRTHGAMGNLTFEEALSQLLNGTGLTYRYLSDRAVTLMPIHPQRDSRQPD